MNDDLKDILSNLNKDIEQEKLLQYLNSGMTDKEQHDFEKDLNNDEFASDAVEGLEQMESTKDLKSMVEQMNMQLKAEIIKKNKRRKRRKPLEQPWTYYAILIVLLLAILTYIVIRRL